MSNLLLSAIKERVKHIGFVSLKLSGHSMYPTIRDGDKITIEYQNFEDVQVNDVIAYHFEKLDHFVVHRVIRIENIHGKKVMNSYSLLK